MGLVFGLDGGGTSSRIRVADEANQGLWEGRGEAVNPNAVSFEVAIPRLAELIRLSARAVGKAVGDFDAGCLGLAGVGRPDEAQRVAAELQAELGPCPPLRIVTDAEIALVGGLESLEGLMLLAGTGSIALARARDGSLIRSGGLGHWLGDEGSAFFLGFEALRRSLRSREGRDLETGLLPELLARFGLASPEEAIGFVYHRFDKARIASAADLVLARAKAGDPLAMDIRRETLEELVLLAASVYSRAETLGAAKNEILLWGGLFDHNPSLAADLGQGLKKSMTELQVVSPRQSAEYGACMLALEARS